MVLTILAFKGPSMERRFQNKAPASVSSNPNPLGTQHCKFLVDLEILCFFQSIKLAQTLMMIELNFISTVSVQSDCIM